MKFYSESIWTPETDGFVMTKTYFCPSCGYKRKILDKGSTMEEIEGDKEFILFPFFSLVKANGEHAELAACPKCQTIQYVERVSGPDEIETTLN